MDGDWVRGYAGEVGELATQVQGLAAGLRAARAESWRSSAAEEFRATLEEQHLRLVALATALDEARGALEAHARAVDETLAGPLGSLAAQAAQLVGLHL